ncbi:MAG: FAD-dependent oxidoreductase, partial [Planctomycetota bacterium]|nr:FAD-dependent oxidoreductase [Planctomycetota bacterium]
SVRGLKRNMVRSLVYPVPSRDLAGLGIHTVVDLGGGLKLGPDAKYVGTEDYTVDRALAKTFCESVRPFLPFIESEDLAPDMSGIRAKLSGPGEPPRDFHVAHEAAAGAPGFFNLAGIESPGLTASPAIARMVADMVGDFLA